MLTTEWEGCFAFFPSARPFLSPPPPCPSLPSLIPTPTPTPSLNTLASDCLKNKEKMIVLCPDGWLQENVEKWKGLNHLNWNFLSAWGLGMIPLEPRGVRRGMQLTKCWEESPFTFSLLICPPGKMQAQTAVRFSGISTPSVSFVVI